MQENLNRPDAQDNPDQQQPDALPDEDLTADNHAHPPTAETENAVEFGELDDSDNEPVDADDAPALTADEADDAPDMLIEPDIEQNDDAPPADDSPGDPIDPIENESAEADTPADDGDGDDVADQPPEAIDPDMPDAADSSPEPKPSTGVTSTAKLLRIDPKLLANVWQNAKKNKSLLSKKDTWLEIITELPRRVRVSLVLIVLLVVAVWWGQSLLASAGITPSLELSLPKNLVSQAAPTPSATPASLESGGVMTLFEITPIPQNTPDPDAAPRFRFHTVQEDETLIGIAGQYDEITTEALILANDIRNPDDLTPGQHLLIPANEGDLRQKIVVHEANENESLLGIAIKYGSSVNELQSANPELVDEPLTAGQQVAVPILFEDNPLPLSAQDEDTIYHTIKPGEMPLSIAAIYDIPVEILLSANNIQDPTRLQIGQQLIIPPHDGISLGYPVILYELQENDSLVYLATKYGSSVKDILAVNPDFDPKNMEAGQLVAIPVIFPGIRPTPAPSAPRPTLGPPPPNVGTLEEQLVAAVNAERVKHGLPPHTVDNQVATAALQHAQDMYVRDFFAHVSPDGISLSDRLINGGVNFEQAGENIQRNTQPRSRTVQAAVNWFMNSAPHRANILHPDHNRIGVAVVEGPPGWYTFVLNFVKR